MLRLAHFSDLHVTVSPAREPAGQLLGKRLVGSINHYLGGRRRHFARAEHRIARLLEDVDAQGVAHALCTGDLTGMSYEPEFRACAALFGDRPGRPERCTILPGNHDRYTRQAARERRFEHWFGSDHGVGGPYPLRKRLAPGVTLVALDVACPTWLFASYGICGDRQLRALEDILSDPALRGDFVVLALHHGPLVAAGRPPSRLSGIIDGPALLRVIDRPEARLDAVVHGHIHDAFWVRRPRPILCAGSATDLSRTCGYNVYEIDPERRALFLERRVWSAKADRFVASSGPVRVL